MALFMMITGVSSANALNSSALDASVMERDPTRPPMSSLAVEQTKQDQPLVLTLVMRQNQQWCAVINEKLVSINDRIEDARVTQINENSVVLDRAGERIVLRMPLGDVRTNEVRNEVF